MKTAKREEGYDTVGIGYYYNASKPYRYYWVQMFIRK